MASKIQAKTQWMALDRPEKGFWCDRCGRFEGQSSRWYEEAREDIRTITVNCTICGLFIGKYTVQKIN